MKAGVWTGAVLSLFLGASLFWATKPGIVLVDEDLIHQAPDGNLQVPSLLCDPPPDPLRAQARRGDRLRTEILPRLELPYLHSSAPRVSWTLSREGSVILSGRSPGVGPAEIALLLVPLPLLAGLLVGGLLGLRKPRVSP